MCKEKTVGAGRGVRRRAAGDGEEKSEGDIGREEDKGKGLKVLR